MRKEYKKGYKLASILSGYSHLTMRYRCINMAMLKIEKSPISVTDSYVKAIPEKKNLQNYQILVPIPQTFERAYYKPCR